MISIIIPSRTGELRFKESILSQNVPKEIIVIKDPEGKGAAWARNEGFKKSEGEHIFFLDDDIELKPNCLEELLNYNRDVVYCNYDRKGKIEIPHRAREFDLEILKKTNYISTMSLIKRDKFTGFDESLKRYQDWDLFLTMAEKGYTFKHVNKTLFTAYYDGETISNLDKEDIIQKENIVRRKHQLELLSTP